MDARIKAAVLVVKESVYYRDRMLSSELVGAAFRPPHLDSSRCLVVQLAKSVEMSLDAADTSVRAT